MDNDIELGDAKPKDDDNKQHKIQASFNTVDPNQSELHSNPLNNKRKDTNNTNNEGLYDIPSDHEHHIKNINRNNNNDNNDDNSDDDEEESSDEPPSGDNPNRSVPYSNNSQYTNNNRYNNQLNQYHNNGYNNNMYRPNNMHLGMQNPQGYNNMVSPSQRYVN